MLLLIWFNQVKEDLMVHFYRIVIFVYTILEGIEAYL